VSVLAAGHLGLKAEHSDLKRAASSADRPDVSFAPVVASLRCSLSAASLVVASWTAICVL